MKPWRPPFLVALTTLTALVAGCGGAGGPPTPSAAPSPTPTAGQQVVSLQFGARVGDAAFSCTQTYPGLGATSSTFTPWDLRFFVHDVTLWTDGGDGVAVALDQDGVWQSGEVALLDFEDKTGTCAGTAETHTRVTGRVPAGTYTGLSFTVGVPFDLNHQDPTLAPSPLNVTAMFWSWAFGYKFVRLEGATTGMTGGSYFHLGSTGCEMDEDDVVTGCDAPNRPSVHLDGFDPGTSVVVFDVAALYEEVDLDANTTGTAPGCMSEPGDPECGPSFAHLGLDFDGTSGDPASQSVFRVE